MVIWAWGGRWRSIVFVHGLYDDTVLLVLSRNYCDGGLGMGLGIFLIAVLYAAVGHGGASGYIAVMTLWGMAPTVMKPIALVLNIGVAGIGVWQFWRSGVMSWRLLGQVSVLAVPMAFVGGYMNLSNDLLKMLLGLILVLSALRFWLRPVAEREIVQAPPFAAVVMSGGAIGWVAGLTGTGGGIFLTPLMLMGGWAKTKTVSAVSAGFIFLNSIAGLLGNWRAIGSLPEITGQLLGLALCGGAIGSYWGAWKGSPERIKQILGAVLAIAGIKLLSA
jgi:uncharacterized protein